MEALRSPIGSQLDLDYEAFTASMRAVEVRSKNEPVIEAFNEAVLEVLSQSEAYRDLTYGYLQKEQVPNPSYRLNKFFKAHQALLISDSVRVTRGYPDRFADSQVWVDYLTETVTNTSHPDYQKLQSILRRPLQTNRAQRAVIPAFVSFMQNLHRPYEGSAIVHEWGSAGGLVLKALALKKFSPVTYYDGDSSPNPGLSVAFNLAIKGAQFHEGIGIEARPPETSEDIEFLKSCTLDPSQLDGREGPSRTSHYEEDYDLLAETPTPQVSTVKGNFFDLRSKGRAKLANKKAHIAYLPHVLGQNQARADEIITELVLPNLRPGGIILANEYAMVDPANRQKIRFLERWYSEEWLCRTLAFDTSRPQDGFFTLFESRTANCSEVRATAETGELEFMRDFLV